MQRALKTARKLAAHELSQWAIVGGWAVEIHCIPSRQQPPFRHLTDIDFVVPEFDSIPCSLAELFLFGHVHPSDPPAKMLLQFVDTETALRIDVFRAYGRTMSRTFIVEFPTGPMRLAAREDVIARSARLLLDVAVNIPVPEKHARDYIRISEGVLPVNLEVAWEDHRKPGHSCAFRDADQLVRNLISTRDRLLITPQFSTDTRDQFIRSAEPQRGKWSFIDVLREQLGELGVPVLGGLPIGDGRSSRTIPLGTIATLDTATRTLMIEPGVL